MAEQITVPDTLKPATFTGKRFSANGDPIVTASGNKYVFSCHKVIYKSETEHTYYGQLDEHEAMAKWGQRRYVILSVKNDAAEMKMLDGPQRY